MTAEIKNFQLDQIRIDGGTQPRVSIDEQVVDEYAELYGSVFDLPPVTVFFDGTDYWLADGFHRYFANKKIRCDYVFGEVHQGQRRDAVLYSVGANATHGLRRTNADKKKAVLTLLKDGEWREWSDREIAKRCGVSHTFVSQVRTSLVSVASDTPVKESAMRSYKTKHGTTARMNTANIGRSRSNGEYGNREADSPNPIPQPRTALAQSTVLLPHNPEDGARTIVSAMGEQYAHELLRSLTACLQVGHRHQ